MARLNSGAALGIAMLVIGSVIGLAILEAVTPTFFSSLAGFVGVFTNGSTTTGNAEADALLPVFPILLAISGLFLIVTLALRQMGGRG